jgi:ketosteroid isomerase-like protein
MKNSTDVKRPMFFPQSLDDDWSRWILGEWEGTGESDTGQGKGVERIEFTLHGQFLVCRGEAKITEMTPDQVNYLKKNMQASDEEVERFKRAGYQSLQLFTVDQTTGETIGYLFDSLRCIATGRGKREGNREIMEWAWATGHNSTRIREKVSDDKLAVIQRTPMPDGSVMEEKGESVRRRPQSRATTTPDSPEVATVKAFIAAINTQDLAALSALMPDDHEFVDSGGTTVSGRETMLAGWRHYFAMFPDYRIRVDLMLQDGAIVAAFGSWSATYAGKRGPASENAVGGPAVWRALVEDARIKTWQVYAYHTKTTEVIKRSEE